MKLDLPKQSDKELQALQDATQALLDGVGREIARRKQLERETARRKAEREAREAEQVQPRRLTMKDLSKGWPVADGKRQHEEPSSEEMQPSSKKMQLSTWVY